MNIIFRRKKLVKVKDQWEEFEQAGDSEEGMGVLGGTLQSPQRFTCSSLRFLFSLIWMHLCITGVVLGFWALCAPFRSLHCLSYTPTSQVSFLCMILKNLIVLIPWLFMQTGKRGSINFVIWCLLSFHSYQIILIFCFSCRRGRGDLFDDVRHFRGQLS